MENKLLERNHSVLVLVDVQKKLTPLVQEAEQMVKRCEWMLSVAGSCNIPILISEQYPGGLERTVSSLHDLAKAAARFEKLHFSCFKNTAFREEIFLLQRKQVVLIGIETHVCVLQTAFDLQNAGFSVFVVVDAVSSRKEIDHRYALKRMKAAGITLISAEMAFFEWLEKAGTEEFKRLSKAYLR